MHWNYSNKTHNVQSGGSFYVPLSADKDVKRQATMTRIFLFDTAFDEMDSGDCHPMYGCQRLMSNFALSFVCLARSARLNDVRYTTVFLMYRLSWSR